MMFGIIIQRYHNLIRLNLMQMNEYEYNIFSMKKKQNSGFLMFTDHLAYDNSLIHRYILIIFIVGLMPRRQKCQCAVAAWLHLVHASVHVDTAILLRMSNVIRTFGRHTHIFPFRQQPA